MCPTSDFDVGREMSFAGKKFLIVQFPFFYKKKDGWATSVCMYE